MPSLCLGGRKVLIVTNQGMVNAGFAEQVKSYILDERLKKYLYFLAFVKSDRCKCSRCVNGLAGKQMRPTSYAWWREVPSVVGKRWG